MFDFSQYEPGFREYVQKNNLSGGGRMMRTLPGGLSLYNTGEIDAFGDYMKSIGADDYYSQYSQSIAPVPSIGFGSPAPVATPAPAPVATPAPASVATPAPAPVATPAPARAMQTPLPTTQPSVSMQSTGDRNMVNPDGVTETITRAAPAPYAEPFLEYGMQEALRQYQGGPQQYYPGSTVVGFSPQTEQALRMQEQRALSGSPITQQAQQLTQQTLGGGFLGGSPQLAGAIERALAPAQARVTSGLAQRGRLGSGAAADVMSQTLGDIAGDIAYRDYAQERAYQQAALGLAPQMSQMDYGDISRLAQVGGLREEQAQRELGADIGRFEFEQQAQQQALRNYLANIGAIDLGQTQSQLQPYFEPSTGQQFLGGAALGASLLGQDATTSERLAAGLLGGGIISAFG